MKAFERRPAKGQIPVALLLLCGALFLTIQQIGPARPWTPPFMGQANLSQVDSSDWEFVFDTRAWPDLEKLNLVLPPSSPSLERGRIYRWQESGLESFEASRGKSTFASGPRASLAYDRGGLEFMAQLYQNQVGVALMSGPIRAKLPSEFFRPESSGVDLEALRMLPLDVERVLLVDTQGIQVPEALWLALQKEWKRWEFEPQVTLQGAFASPFVYALWRGDSVLMCALNSPAALQEELARRFPSSLIPSTVRWSQGHRILGFQEQRNPSWYFRGDFLVATPEGGTDRLVEFLEYRNRDLAFRKRDRFFAELQRLAEGEKGWHLCIIERSAEKPIHWAALLRWSDSVSGQAEGYLIVDTNSLSQDAQLKAKDSLS